MDKKLKLQGGKLNSPPGALPLDPAGGSSSSSRCVRACSPRNHDPLLGQILDPALHVGSGSEVPEAEHIAITILQRCVNQKPRKFFFSIGISRGVVTRLLPYAPGDKYRDSIEYRDTFARYLSWKRFWVSPSTNLNNTCINKCAAYSVNTWVLFQYGVFPTRPNLHGCGLHRSCLSLSLTLSR